MLQVPKFVPSDKVKIETDPNAKGPPVDSSMAADDETKIEELCEQLDGIRSKLDKGYKLSPITFEKDNDANHHMDLITALANNRARNYSIPEVWYSILFSEQVAFLQRSVGRGASCNLLSIGSSRSNSSAWQVCL